MSESKENEELDCFKNTAEALYGAYSDGVGGSTYDGKPLPAYSELGTQQKGWIAVAEVLTSEVDAMRAACKEECKNSKM